MWSWTSLGASGGVSIVKAAGRMTRERSSPGTGIIGGYSLPATVYVGQNPTDSIWNYGRFNVAALDSETLWGNATQLGHITTAIDACQADGWFPGGRVHLVGGSHGAAVSIKWAAANRTRIRSLTLAICPFDLEWGRANNILGLGSSIASALGNPVPDAENPIKLTSQLAGVPIYVAYSTNDPVCPVATAEQFIAETGAYGINMGAVGHNWDNDLHNAKTQADWILAH